MIKVIYLQWVFLCNVQGELWNPGEQGERSGRFFILINVFSFLTLVGRNKVEKMVRRGSSSKGDEDADVAGKW